MSRRVRRTGLTFCNTDGAIASVSAIPVACLSWMLIFSTVTKPAVAVSVGLGTRTPPLLRQVMYPDGPDRAVECRYRKQVYHLCANFCSALVTWLLLDVSCPPAETSGESMSHTEAAALSPETVMRQMKQNGVTDIVWLPDSETNWLYLLMQADPALRLVGVTREGHACPIAAGLYAGGRKPMILIQNTGMMESGDSIRGWLKGLQVPIVLMVGYRGYTRHGVNTDTAATYTERFLMAFNIPFYLVEGDADAERISVAFAEAEKTKQPVVVLVGDEYHGFNR